MLKNTKVILVYVTFLSSLLVSKPATAQTTQQLDRLSINELKILFRHQWNNAQIVVQSCYKGAASYPIMQNSCNIQKMQYENYFNQFRLYIARRQVLGR